MLGYTPLTHTPLDTAPQTYTPWTPPRTPPPDTIGYGQQAGGTHPTGMHTCFNTKCAPASGVLKSATDTDRSHWRIQGGGFMRFSAKNLKNNSTFGLLGSWRIPLGKIPDPPLDLVVDAYHPR